MGPCSHVARPATVTGSDALTLHVVPTPEQSTPGLAIAQDTPQANGTAKQEQTTPRAKGSRVYLGNSCDEGAYDQSE